jgi:hypothetical protein
MIERALILIGLAIAAVGTCTAQQGGSSSSSSIIADPCRAYDYKQFVGVTRPSVCERDWIDGTYVCRDFARDACNEWRKAGTRAWKITMSADIDISNTTEISQCLKKMCGIDLCQHLSGISGIDDKLKGEIAACASKIRGHAENVVEITDATKRRLGDHAFAVIEPQDGNPTTAVKCTWTQASPTPVIPEDCKTRLLESVYGANAFVCGFSWKFKIVDCNTLVSGDPGYSSSSSSSAGTQR